MVYYYMKCYSERYNLLTQPPFVDNNKTSLFKKILYEEPNYTAVRVSTDAVSLLKSLLEKNPKKRIDPKKISEHSFFKELDFNQVEFLKVKPPFKPKIVNNNNFRKIWKIFRIQILAS